MPKYQGNYLGEDAEPFALHSDTIWQVIRIGEQTLGYELMAEPFGVFQEDEDDSTKLIGVYAEDHYLPIPFAEFKSGDIDPLELQQLDSFDDELMALINKYRNRATLGFLKAHLLVYAASLDIANYRWLDEDGRPY